MPPLDMTAAVRTAFRRIADSSAENVWISLRDEDEVLRDAEKVAARLAAGEDLPLAGRTFAVKDNIDVAGMATTAAHPGFSRVAERDATAVARLVDAGALLVGKTNLDQFATGLVGARSPYGAVASAVDPSRVAGGSSSGSAVAVALGLVDFSLGTDTAGSGRVPAAFNGIVGLKPTLGLVPRDGVVPACPSYDTISVFARDVASATRVLAVLQGPSDLDPHSRPWPESAPQAAPPSPTIAIPRQADLAAMTAAMRSSFSRSVDRLRAQDATTVEVDMTPFLEAATLLYDGGLVAERGWSFGSFLAAHPEHADPSVAAIARRAMEVPGTQVVADQQRLLALTALGRRALSGTDALMIPTAPLHPTHAQLAEDPLRVNAAVGTFTNFVNLMDMSAAAIPTGPVDGEGETGVTFVAPAFHDQVVADLAARFVGEDSAGEIGAPGIDVAVFGAHLRGEALNHQLIDLGARFVRETRTAPRFRMLLVEGTVDRPAVVRSDDGAELPGEVWRLSPAALASLLTRVAAPLALGEIELADGTTVIGFTASVTGAERDITHPGGWRAHRRSAPVTA